MFIKHFFVCLLFVISNTCNAAVVIQSRIDNGAWKKTTAIYPLKGQTVTLKVAKVSGAKIRWYQIIPDISKMYKNANFPWDKNPYKWVGFGKIAYERHELTHFRNQWQIKPFEKIESKKTGYFTNWFSSPKKTSQMISSNSRFYQEDIGSFWFQVEIEKLGKIRKSVGIEQSNNQGLSKKVFRVSIRDGKGYLGYITSFFNVPAIFGSTTYQSNNYIGVDCADVMVAAYSKLKGRRMKKNYNVAMLVNKLKKRTQFDLVNGTPNKNLKWRKDIYAGDLIAVKYQGARQYQHIGALYKDANNNGFLDKNDLVIHAGPYPLQFSALRSGGFDGHVVILKPSNRIFSSRR
jgi:hypothetical protein